MKIGDKVIINKKRKSFEEFNNYKKGKIIQKYENFIVVRLEKGYNECFKESELSLEK